MELYTDTMDSPIGFIEIEASNSHLLSVTFKDSIINISKTNHITKEAVDQLTEYFQGKLKNFTIPLQPNGTEFRLKVWKALSGIAFGQLKSYKDIALEIGSLLSVRAVGTANGANPIPIIIPCHRVIGSDKSLIGYSAGLWRKIWLLEHEKAGLQGTLFDS